jgi:hypothetical protein
MLFERFTPPEFASQVLVSMLADFERRRWPRIRAGKRLPADREETLLAQMLADPQCPRTADRILSAE